MKKADFFCNYLEVFLMNTNEKHCENCGAACQSNERFCHVCGEPFYLPQAKPARQTRRSLPHFSIPTPKIFARNLVFLVLSSLIFLFSFLPIVKYPLEIEIGKDFEDTVPVEISVFDCVTFLSDTFYFLDEADLKESDLADNIKLLSDELAEIDYDDKSSFTSYEKGLISTVTKDVFRLGLRSEKSPVRPFLITTTVLSLFYVLFAFIVFAVSIWNFVALLLGRPSVYHGLIKCFCFTPVLALIAYFTVDMALSAYSFGGGLGEMAFPIGILVASSVGILYAFITKFISTHGRLSLSSLFMRVITLGMSIALICMLATPMVTMSVNTVFSGRDTKRAVDIGVGAESFWGLELSEDEFEDINDQLGKSVSTKKEFINSFIQSLGNFTIKDIRNGKADSVVSALANYSLVAYCGNNSVFASFIPYLLILAALSAAFIAWQNLVFLAVHRKPFVVPAHVFMHLSTIASLVLGIIYVLFINNRLYLLKLSSSVSASIGAGLILFVAFGIVLSLLSAINTVLPTYRAYASASFESEGEIADIPLQSEAE